METAFLIPLIGRRLVKLFPTNDNLLSDLPSLNRKKPSNSMQVLLSLPISRFTGHAHTGLYGNGFIKQRWLHPPLLSAQGFVPVINSISINKIFVYTLICLLVYIVLDYFLINLIIISFYDTLYTTPHHLTEHDYRSYQYLVPYTE